MRHYCHYLSPLGQLVLTEEDGFLLSLSFDCPQPPPPTPTPLLAAACRQLEEYFCGQRREFSLPLDPAGTPFLRECWGSFPRIPYGETRTYRELALALGYPGLGQALGQAARCNPLPILLPCHRLLAQPGEAGGYVGGLWRKRFLLTLEQQHRPGVRTLE